MGIIKEEDLKRHKMFREVEEEIRRLKCYFDYLEDDDLEEIGTSLSKMFDIGFNYSQNLKKTKEVLP